MSNVTLLAVPAGRCLRRSATSSTVDPQIDKGTLSFVIEDGLLHLYWRNNETSSLVDDLIIFAGDAAFSLVPHPTHTILLLTFASSRARHFFYLSTLHAATYPAALLERLNAIIENPDAAQSLPALKDEAPTGNQASTSTQASALGAATPAPASRVMQAPDAPTRPSTSTQAAAPKSSEFDSETMQQMRDIITSVGNKTSSEQQEDNTLTSILNPKTIIPLLKSDQTLLQSLLPHLPQDLPGPHDEEAVARLIRSSAFSHSVRSLQAALNSGALGPMMHSWDLPAEAGLSVESFLAAVSRQAEEGDKDKMETD